MPRTFFFSSFLRAEGKTRFVTKIMKLISAFSWNKVVGVSKISILYPSDWCEEIEVKFRSITNAKKREKRRNSPRDFRKAQLVLRLPTPWLRLLSRKFFFLPLTSCNLMFDPTTSLPFFFSFSLGDAMAKTSTRTLSYCDSKFLVFYLALLLGGLHLDALTVHWE